MSGFHRLAALLIALAVAEGGNGRIGAQSPSGISPALYAGLTWRCIGPFDGGPVASVEGVAGQPGIYTITTPSGGAWKTIDGGDTWTTLDRSIGTNASADPHRWVDPANPRRIARTDSKGIEVSLDAGKTWTASHHLPIAEVESLEGGKGGGGGGGQINIRVADPARAGLMFAGTNTGVEVSFDNGVRWVSLHLNMPAVAINDLAIRGNNVIAATQGRSTWILEDISPLRQLTATAAAAPMTLFKPADVISSADAVALDYLIGRVPRGNVTLEVIDAAGRVVHAISSAPPDPADGWLPVTRSLSTTPGHHRVTWNLRFDPPPSPQHKYAQAARAILHEMPADRPSEIPARDEVVRRVAGIASRISTDDAFTRRSETAAVVAGRGDRDRGRETVHARCQPGRQRLDGPGDS